MIAIVTLIAWGSMPSRLAIRRAPRHTFAELGTVGRETFRVSHAPGRFVKLCGAEFPSLGMGLSVCSLALAALAFLTLPVYAGTARQSHLLQAQQLSSQGEFAQVIRVLEPLVQGDPDTLDDASRGMAWNLLGSAHQNLGDNESARRCYEAAIHLLRRLPDSVSTYASSLDSLGSVEISIGQMEAAEAALRKAKGLYAKIGDHAGLADVAIDLAILAMARNNTHAARRFLVDALREAKSTQGLSDGDQATIYGIKGTLAARAGDFAAAISDYQQSIDFWIRARGPKYYLVAGGYAMQANAYLEIGDYSKANTDITAALVLVEQTVGRNTPLYAETELTYARLLRATGANAEAARRETEAKATLEAIRRQQCSGCAISAASFR